MTQAPPRVLHVVSHPIQYFVPLYRRLTSDAQIDLTVAYGRSLGLGGHLDREFGHELRWDIPLLGGYHAVFLDKAGAGRVGALRRLWRLVRSGGFDVVWVHGYTPLLSLAALSMARALRIPLLLRDEANLDQDRGFIRRLARRTLLRAELAGVVCLAIGTRNRQHWLQQGVSTDRIVDAPYTVDNAFFIDAAAQVTKTAARERFKLPSEVPVALFVGKLIEKKDPMTLVGALARAQQQKRVALLVVGEGQLRAHLQAEVARLGVTDVVFAGFLNQSEMPLAYAAADFLVLPSIRRETWGLVVNESMNFGLAVIISNNVGCADDLIEDGLTGYIFPARDEVALANRILLLCEQPRLTQMGANARRRIARWDIGDTAEGIEQAVRISTRSRLIVA